MIIMVLSALLSFGCSEEERAAGLKPPEPAASKHASEKDDEKSIPISRPRPIIMVSDQTPDPYTHPSTHPDSLHEELNLDDNAGHGDGITDVDFVGKVVFLPDSGELLPIEGARFYRTNDSMLLEEKRKTPLEATSSETGDFSMSLMIFAASGCVKESFDWNGPAPFAPGQHDSEIMQDYREKARSDGEWVVYQTGTARIRVEAEGFEPREVNVRYDQPSTLIVLNQGN